MHLPPLLSFLRRPFALILLAIGVLAAAPGAHALSANQLNEFNLPGKTLQFTIVGGNAPFETSGTFDIVFGTNGTYTMPLASGNAAFRSGTYTLTADSFATTLRLNGYILNNATVSVSILYSAVDLRSQFEMFTTGANKNGTVVFSSSNGGGNTNGAPAITSATTATATVGQPFTYQITTNPAATSYTNAGGNAPVLIPIATGLVSGVFNSAGTFTFSFTASNAAGSSPVTTVTVTVTPATAGPVAPVINSLTTASATVGQPFTYQITATNSPATYNVTVNSLTPIPTLTFNATTGLVSATFSTPGLYIFNAFATNSAGTGNIQVGVTVSAASTGDTSRYAGRYLGKLGSRVGTTVNTNLNDYEALIAANGSVVVNVGALPAAFTGTIAANGVITFTGGTGIGTYNITSGLVEGTTFMSSYGALLGGAQYRFEFSTSFTPAGATAAPVITSASSGSGNVGSAYSYQIVASNSPTGYLSTGLPAGLTLNATTGLISGTPTTAGTYTVNLTATNSIGSGAARLTLAVGAAVVNTISTAPVNLVGYRNKVGQAFQFTVTGSTAGSVWGTEVYTDDSTIARAAVHAGVLAVGETRTVTITLLPGQSSYAASTRNGVSSASWGSWSGSYSFAGAGAVISTTNVATTRPVVAPGYVATTTSLATGGRLVFPIAVTGGGTYTYQWYFNNTLLLGATANPYIVESVTAAQAGTYTVDVTNSLGTARLTAGTIAVGTSGAPVLALQPISKTVVPGATFTLAANASGTANTYQWLRNNVALPGETGAILLRNNASANDSGSYAVRVTNSSGTVTSNAATIKLSANASRPANISVRANAANGALVSPGFVIQGSGTKRVLIRAVGPGLGAFGLSGTMADPKFTVFQGSTKVTENDNWTAANIGTAFDATGAFALTAGSRDAALVTDLAAGKDYTVQVTNASGGGGIVLIEIYDADILKGDSTSKLVNVSVRGQTAPGDDVLTLGLVIGGTGPRTLLVRGVGPKLASFGVTGTVADPRLQIIDGQGRAILANDDWGSADFVSELALATGYVGAFGLDAGSKDAATLTLLEPGAYTIQVSGAAAAPTGEALVEVYEVP